MSTPKQEVQIPADGVMLEGSLVSPQNARGVVAFAHGSGSSRHSPRNQAVARGLQESGLATLLMDLLTRAEEQEEAATRHHRFNITMLADRLVSALDWMQADSRTAELVPGFFGASTGGGAALVAAARRPEVVRAVVSRGGRPDLAGDSLPHVQAATLLIVGGNDTPVIGMNEDAMRRLRCTREMVIVPGASHLFEEPGALDEVTRLAAGWFTQHLAPAYSPPVGASPAEAGRSI